MIYIRYIHALTEPLQLTAASLQDEEDAAVFVVVNKKKKESTYTVTIAKLLNCECQDEEKQQVYFSQHCGFLINLFRSLTQEHIANTSNSFWHDFLKLKGPAIYWFSGNTHLQN